MLSKCFGGQRRTIHQIRKMVDVAITVITGITEEAAIARAFTEEQFDLPRAPGLGLVLDQVRIVSIRYGEDGIHKPLTWEELEPEIEEFVEKYIYSNIYATEQNDKSMLELLDTLKKHSYDARENKDVTTQTSPVIIKQIAQ